MTSRGISSSITSQINQLPINWPYVPSTPTISLFQNCHTPSPLAPTLFFQRGFPLSMSKSCKAPVFSIATIKLLNRSARTISESEKNLTWTLNATKSNTVISLFEQTIRKLEPFTRMCGLGFEGVSLGAPARELFLASIRPAVPSAPKAMIKFQSPGRQLILTLLIISSSKVTLLATSPLQISQKETYQPAEASKLLDQSIAFTMSQLVQLLTMFQSYSPYTLISQDYMPTTAIQCQSAFRQLMRPLVSSAFVGKNESRLLLAVRNDFLVRQASWLAYLCSQMTLRPQLRTWRQSSAASRYLCWKCQQRLRGAAREWTGSQWKAASLRSLLFRFAYIIFITKMSYEQLKRKPPEDFQFLKGLPSLRISPSLLKFTLHPGKRPRSPDFKLFLDVTVYDNRGNQLNKFFKLNSSQSELYKTLALNMDYKENAIFLVSDQQLKPLEECTFKFYSLTLIAEEDTREYPTSVQGILHRALDNKERGNLYYKDKQFMQANKCYRRAFNLLKQIFLRSMSAQEKEQCIQVLKTSLLNLLQTAIVLHESDPSTTSQAKLQQSKQKVESFQLINRLSQNPKFKFRFGKVLFYLGEYQRSEDTLKEALGLGVMESKEFLSKINKTQNNFYKKLFAKLPEQAEDQ